MFKKLTLLKPFGGHTVTLDCIVVKKYSVFYSGGSVYHSKTREICEEDLKQKIEEELTNEDNKNLQSDEIHTTVWKQINYD